VFKKKAIGCYKARLIAHSFSQVYKQDYFKTYVLIACLTSIQTLLALAAKYQLKIQQINIKTAFLYKDLNKKIYIKLLKGYDDNDILVCKLVKSIYSLKQASKV
jgi:3-isopropylmalate dehydratase small subunit